MTDSVIAVMKAQRRWLIANPDKAPFYVNGQMRNGTLDSPTDIAQLASYDDAHSALATRGDGWLLGFALGPDGTGGHWQGIDLDKVVANQLADIANSLPGYVEMSPSGAGAHAIGYGRHFVTLGSNGTGIEAYSAGRYFTVTERLIRDNGLVCLAAHIEQVLAPRHSVGRAAPNTEQVSIDPKVVTEIRSALLHMRSDEYDVWYRMGLALKELGETGRGLWLEWSATSEKFDANKASKKWDGFEPRDTGYQAVFAEAARQGWVNPGRNDAQPQAAPAANDESGAALLNRFSIDWSGEGEADVPDIVDGLVADEDVTLLGGHGGVGKSFLGLQTGCAVALGEPILGCATRQCRVLYYSAEDGRKRLTRRLRRVVETFDYDTEALRENLRVLDASEVEPLYGERLEPSPDGKRFAKMLGATADFENLRRMVEEFDPQLVIIDGASDTFDGNEIARREVRAFIKILRRLHPHRKIGVMLLVHIDRSSARGNVTNDDGYAGSAQWHNSCRRRVFLQHQIKKDEDGAVTSEGFILRVMKNQDGENMPEMDVQRGEFGLWQLGVQVGGDLAPDNAADHAATILRLVGEYCSRGKSISISLAGNAPTGIYATLKGDPAFPPGLNRKRTADIIRDLERSGALVVEPYKRTNRTDAERWAIGRDPNQPFEQGAQPAHSGTQ